MERGADRLQRCRSVGFRRGSGLFRLAIDEILPFHHGQRTIVSVELGADYHDHQSAGATVLFGDGLDAGCAAHGLADAKLTVPGDFSAGEHAMRQVQKRSASNPRDGSHHVTELHFVSQVVAAHFEYALSYPRMTLRCESLASARRVGANSSGEWAMGKRRGFSLRCSIRLA